MRLIQDVEAAGFDGAGILDSQLLSRDAFVVLAQAATQCLRTVRALLAGESVDFGGTPAAAGSEAG
ncbi:MAG TPA: hypothetical protein VMT79_09385 [Candidatus Binatia bacterium]|nr:hypothetical protein [Candidatus Binatia bacterium]